MARIDFLDPADASEDVQRVFEVLPAQLNIFKMAAHAEASFRPLLSLGTSILGAQELDGKLREFVILLAGKLTPGRYEWTQHVPIALATGATQEQIDALDAENFDADCFDDVEKDLIAFAVEVIRDVRASDDTFARAKARFSNREIVEIIMTCGYYMMMARITECTDTDIDKPVGTLITDAVKR